MTPNSLPELNFHSLFHCFIRRLYYSRITVTGSENIPHDGPILALCLHRNGAVDGFVYLAAISHLTFLVRKKLRRGLIGKLFFPGLNITRSGDGGRPEDTLKMIADCASALQSGSSLAIFPEGTSNLGPRHLPFKSGAARIALSHHKNGDSLTILPMGIHYECPWAFRSRVEIVVAPPISMPSTSPSESKGAVLGKIRKQFTVALEDVGINVSDNETQTLLQKFAYIATLGTTRSYFSVLKSLEGHLPPKAVSAWKEFEAKTEGKAILKHQGVPLFPLQNPWFHALLALLLGIPVLSGALLNLPPIVIAWYSGKRFADDDNVIALWRILTGIPLFVVWMLAWITFSMVLGHPWTAPIYLILTGVAIFGWYRLNKLAVAGWNGLFHSKLSVEVHAFHDLLLRELESDQQSTPESNQ